MRRLVLIVPAAAALACAGVVAAAPPQGTQTDAAFAASYAASGVANVSATTQRVSCYAPELTYFAEPRRPPQGYLDGGMSPCNGAATTGEDLGPYATQDVANPAMRVKDHSESDIRVDPAEPAPPDRPEQVGRQRGGLQPPARLLRVLRRRRDLARAGPRPRL